MQWSADKKRSVGDTCARGDQGGLNFSFSFELIPSLAHSSVIWEIGSQEWNQPALPCSASSWKDLALSLGEATCR